MKSILVLTMTVVILYIAMMAFSHEAFHPAGIIGHVVTLLNR